MSLTHHEPIAFIPTADAEAGLVFYKDTLGLTLVSDDQFALVFKIGPHDTMLRVVRTQDNFTPAPFTIFGWESPNIEADVTALAARGVEFLRFSFFHQDALGIWTAPNGNKVAWFKDPDGNTLSLSCHSE
jgi:catechol 2,3-dioxygenase-like lactoylglutathione lyase family enzyme